MTITNKMGLPEAFLNFCSTVRHNKPGCVSATTLLHGEKEIVLTDREWENLTQDAADMVWSAHGSAFHLLMESQKDDSFKEEYFEVDVNGMKVTGKVDRYDLQNEILEDWKTTSAWKIIYKEFEDWKRQGLIYAWLMKQQNLPVRKCRFIAMLKDHSATKASTDSSYPEMPVYVYEFEVTEQDLAEIENFIKTKVEKIQKAYKLPNDEISPCSEDERWQDPPTYAVMKPGRKTAVRVFQNREDAEIMVRDNTNYNIVDRPSEPRKCGKYCICHDYCNFYQEHKKLQEAAAKAAAEEQTA